jgi:hypothetical protein
MRHRLAMASGFGEREAEAVVRERRLRLQFNGGAIESSYLPCSRSALPRLSRACAKFGLSAMARTQWRIASACRSSAHSARARL